MNIQDKKLDNGKIELTIEVSIDELVPYIEKAATTLSERQSIPGFRPGKAPLDVIKARLGEMTILQEAVQQAVPQTLYSAVQEKKLVTVGQPEIVVQKLAPNNPLVYTATVVLMPEVTLGKWQSIKLPYDEPMVSTEEVDKVVNDFASWQATETAVDRPAKTGDKVEVDFEVLVDNVVIEGGKATKYPIILGSASMIPGMEEQLAGMKAGEEKEFNLNFPSQYFQAALAGKEAKFKVKMITVLQRNLPTINDDWTQKLVGKTLLEWRQELREGILGDKKHESGHAWENAAIEQIIGVSNFSDIPQLLIDNEIAKMLQELQHSIESRKMKWDEYLHNIKKSETDLKQEFSLPATNRVKAALVMRQIAKEQNISITIEELEHDLAEQEKQYTGDERALGVVRSSEFREYMENVLINRKVAEVIRQQLLGKK